MFLIKYFLGGVALGLLTTGAVVMGAKLSHYCRPYLINNVAVGTQCSELFSDREYFDIDLEYQIAFLEKEMELPTQSVFDDREILPPQRIPGTSLYYDYIPLTLEPEERLSLEKPAL